MTRSSITMIRQKMLLSMMLLSMASVPQVLAWSSVNKPAISLLSMSQRQPSQSSNNRFKRSRLASFQNYNNQQSSSSQSRRLQASQRSPPRLLKASSSSGKSSSSKLSALHFHNDPNLNVNDNYLVEDPKKLDTSVYVWFLPLINMLGAFCFYTQTQTAFRGLMDMASGRLWVNVDGNNFMTEIVKPVLNGPVTLSISILFGTLTSMTIQTLYRRQISLHQTLISTVEEVRELQWLVEGFPEPYKGQAHRLLAQFLQASFADFQTSTVTPDSIRSYEMTQMLLLLNGLTREPNSPDIIICEAYGCVHRLKDRRAEFMSGLQTVFSGAHYTVIGLLASTLLFVFLLETDNDTLQFLLDFQLSICWALLIGSYSMLAVIIYDLSNPFSGIFSTMKGVDFVASELATEVVLPDIMERTEELEGEEFVGFDKDEFDCESDDDKDDDGDFDDEFGAEDDDEEVYSQAERQEMEILKRKKKNGMVQTKK